MLEKEDVGQSMGAFTKEFNQHIEKEEIKEMKKPKLEEIENDDLPLEYNTP